MSSETAVPHSLRVGEILTVVFGLGLSTIAVAVRVYTKARLTKKMLSEDYFSVFALVSFLAYIGLGVVIGKNRHDPARAAYLSSIESAVYCPVIVAVKISILLQYVTIFVLRRRTSLHYTIHALIWINVVYYFIGVMLGFFLCPPNEMPLSHPNKCPSKGRTWVVSGAINVLSDFSILCLPMPIIYRLQIPWNKKCRIFAVFLVGLFASATSVVRLAYSVEMLGAKSRNPASRQLLVHEIGLWGCAEISLGIIAGCMPVLPRFFKEFSSPHSSAKFRLFSAPTTKGTSWRRLLRRSTTNNSSNKDSTPPISDKVTASKECAPDIASLNPKSSSTHFTEGYIPSAPATTHMQGRITDVSASPLTPLEAGAFLDLEDTDEAERDRAQD